MKNYTLTLILVILKMQLAKADYYAPAQDAKTYLWGYINQKGKKVTKFKYRLAFNFSQNKAIVLRDKWYFLDKESLKEHVFDDTLQQYFSAAVRALLKSEKQKYYNDSNWVINNLLNPPNTAIDYNGGTYSIFHFITPNKLLLDNTYLEKKSSDFKKNSLYDVSKGFIRKYDKVYNLSDLYFNMHFIGFTGDLVDIEKEQLGLFDTSANLLISLDTIKNILRDKFKALPYYPTKNRKDLYKSIIYNFNSYTELSATCATLKFGLMDSEPDPYAVFDSSFLVYFPEIKILTLKPTHLMNNMEKDSVIALCKCYGTDYNYRKKNSYVYETDTLLVNDSTFAFLEKSQWYYAYYSEEYIKKYKQALKLYAYAEEQEKDKLYYGLRNYLWGVWDGEKVIVKPKYYLIGVFN